MAWLIGDSFDFYNAGADLLLNADVWASFVNTPFLTNGGRFVASGRSLVLGTGGSAGATVITRTFANSTTLFVNMNIVSSQAHVNGGTTPIIGFAWRDENGPAIQGGVYLRNGGDFIITSGPTGGTILGTSPVLAPSANVWMHIEVKIVVNGTTGSVELRHIDINGASTPWVVTGINTRNGTANPFANSIQIQGTSASSDLADDFYVFNDQGIAPNDWQGDVYSYPLRPNSDISVSWNRNTGTHNFEAVDDTAEDGDTTMVSTNVVNAVDHYGVNALATEPLTTVAVTLTYMARMDDAGPHQVTAQLISGPTTDSLPALILTNSYVIHQKTYPQDPNTSALWAAANVDALILGIKLLL